ncbi:MAG TPA: DUF4395 domain-containing protein [Dehalococcoidia bacterium]|nr:DUF4395 domain-containing protein [Dehalococcoidia bacterium]
MKSILSFPNPVNEVAARSVAGMVLALALATILTGEPWLLLFLVYGFVARVLTGPTLSPIGLIATRLVVPLLNIPEKPVPGPPKRFAQFVGLVVSLVGAVLFIWVSPIAGKSVLGVLAVFAALESGFGFCAGCFVFGYLMRWGLIPESVCLACRID